MLLFELICVYVSLLSYEYMMVNYFCSLIRFKKIQDIVFEWVFSKFLQYDRFILKIIDNVLLIESQNNYMRDTGIQIQRVEKGEGV